jgi:NAD(P)-dependent dehydrogenase (short-subunit alcohol dehydrogenase family)
MQVFLVTNADAPAGSRIALDLLRSGHRVVVTGIKATALVRITHGYSCDRVLAIAADISDPHQMRRLLECAEKRFSAIDFAVAQVR